MVRGIVIFGRWAILAALIGSLILLTGCNFWDTKPCDSWLKDTNGGGRYCSGERFLSKHWTPPVMEQEQISCKPGTKDRRCA